MNKNILIDYRWSGKSGIGTMVDNLLPFLTKKFNKVYRYYLHLLSIGWYKSNSQNKLVFEQYGGTLPCYVCEKKTPYQDS